MFKDAFNLLNVVHKRCILNSNEFCTHLEILKRIFKVVFLFSYQSSVLKELSDLLCFFKFLSLPYRGDLIIIAPPLPYVNNFFQLFLIFFNFFVFRRRNIPVKPHKYWVCALLSFLKFFTIFCAFYIILPIFHIKTAYKNVLISFKKFKMSIEKKLNWHIFFV